MVLVGVTNCIVGVGLLWLAVMMLRRPQRLWVGVRIPRTPEEVDAVRRSNRVMAPLLMLLGLAEVVSGPVAQAVGLPPPQLAFAGLVILLMAIVVVILAALHSR